MAETQTGSICQTHLRSDGTRHLGSAALPGVVSWLSFLLHGAPPLFIRGVLFGCYAAGVIWWAWRFVAVYRGIFHDGELRLRLYQAEGTCTYYLQRGDKLLSRRRGAPDHFPSVWLVVGSIPVGFALLLIAPQVVRWAGLPAPHVLFMVICIPLDMAFISMALRGWLVFFFYPREIFKQTGVEVYVDMTTKPLPLPRQRRDVQRRQAP